MAWGCFLLFLLFNLHDLSWIPISVQSFISVSYLVFEICLLKLNDNNNINNNNNKNFELTFIEYIKYNTDYAI